MIEVYCHTNLDLERCEEWPKYLPALPRVGDYIESSHEWSKGCRLSLKVCAVRWEFRKRGSWDHEGQPQPECWAPRIELSIPPLYKTITEFYEWYGRITGKGKGAYI